VLDGRGRVRRARRQADAGENRKEEAKGDAHRFVGVGA
jgi:hypothetical protein